MFAARAAEPSSQEGFTEPVRNADLSLPETGVITSLPVKEGESVSKGALLAKLDTDVLEAMRAIAKAQMDSGGQLAAAQATLGLKQRTLHTLRNLQASGNARPEELDRSQSEVSVAQANVSAAQEERTVQRLEYQRIQAQIERRVLRAPFDGVVVKISRELGEMIPVDGKPLITLADLSKLRVTLYPPTAQARGLKPGQTVTVRSTEPPATGDGTVEFVSPVTDPESNTVRVTVVIENSKRQFQSGVRCSVDFGPIAAPKP